MKYLLEVMFDVFQGEKLLPNALGRLAGLWLLNFGRLSMTGLQEGDVRGWLDTSKSLLSTSLPSKDSGFTICLEPSKGGTFVQFVSGEH